LRKSHPVIVRPLTTWAAVALAAMVFTFAFASAFAGPAGASIASATAPATTTQASTGPAATQPALTASCVPDPNSFRAFDVPSDGGTGILVQWDRPAQEPDGLTYVVQIAPTEQDFQAGNFKEAPTPAEPGKGPYRVAISPAKIFCPENPEPLTADKLRQFAERNVISAKQLDRAMAARALINKLKPATQPATGPASGPATAASAPAGPAIAPSPAMEPAPAEQAELTWYNSLAGYLISRLGDEFQGRRAEVNARPYCFRLAVQLGGRTELVSLAGRPVVVEASAEANLFKWGKFNNLVLALIFSAIVVTFIEIAKRRPGLFIRKIAGLEAIDEAIGRATEMDRPVYFIHGGNSVDNMSVIAAVNILSHIAYRTAEHDSRIMVMNQDPLVTAVSQEVVQQACTRAGRPDAYNPDNVSLIAYEQFAFVAAVSGLMVREKPGAIFMMGYFGAESLLLAETGSSTGAIQVAGTDAYTQLPFFVTTCDYTLMGEELYAASAYLSREPRLLGSLRGQDIGKAFIMFLLLAGTIFLTLAGLLEWKVDWLRHLFEASRS